MNQRLPHDDCSRNDVAEPLAGFRDGDARDSYEIREDRLEIDNTKEIANGGRGKPDGVSAVTHRAKAEQSLAGSLAVAQSLEEQIVAPENHELHDDQDGGRPRCSGRGLIRELRCGT